MKWVAISGSWRKINDKVEKDVRDVVRDIISRGDGIVVGGALNVDSIATDEALKLEPSAEKIKIFLPVILELYAAHYRKRAREEVITLEQAESLVAQLEQVKTANSEVIIENKNNKIVNEVTYHERNTKVVEAVDELVAFWVNKSPGVGDTIEKAKARGIPVKVFEYTIE